MNLEPTTLVFELVNFLVLLWVLQRLVYRPLHQAIHARREELAEERAGLQAQREALEKEQTELDEGLDRLDELQAQVRREATEAAVKERARILEGAREDAASERARVQALLASERKATEAWVRSVAVERGTEVAGALLKKLAPEALDAALERGLVQAIDAHQEQLRHSWEREGGELPEAELVGATLPGDRAVKKVREALTGAVGARPRLHVREDDRLEAGLLLRLGDGVLCVVTV